MTTLPLLHEAMARLDEVWPEVGGVGGLPREEILDAGRAIGAMTRALEALHAELAAAIAEESRSELGPEGLAKQQGYRTAAALISGVTGVSSREASRLIAVGEATAPRFDLVGAPRPARYPRIQRALQAGELSVAAAGMIIALLERCRVAVGVQRVAEGERVLVEAAAGLALDDVRRLVARAEAWLDPDGVEPRADEARARRSLLIFERGGMVHLSARLDPETAAPLVAAVRGYVTAAFAARQDAPDSDAPDADRRTVPALQADALALFCAHALGCENGGLPVAGASVVVRMTLDDLQSGRGVATIDGIDQAVGVSAARRMAGSGGVIPCVLGGDSEVLDWGREKRLFTRAQRLALVERDGGCAMCGLPPQMTRAHHIRWWSRDRGLTDLSNGVLLSESCHHRIHDNGWDVVIDGPGVSADVWFVPPTYVDRVRVPRRGARARVRFDRAA